jgi:hypothetical protein
MLNKTKVITVQSSAPKRADGAIIDFAFTHEDEAAAQSLGIITSGPITDCINRAVVSQNAATSLTLETGYLLLKAKSQAEHGEFGKHLKAHGVDQFRAAELMRTAKFYTSLAEDQRKSIFHLGKTKMQLLASADSEVIDDILNDPDSGLESLSVRSLRQRVMQLEREKNDIQARFNTADSKLKRLGSDDKPRLTKFEPRTEEIRAECMALQLGVELNTNSLQKLFDEVNAEDRRLPEWRLQVEQLWVTAHAMAARAIDMLGHVKDTVRVDDMPERVQGPHILTPDEAARWLLDYPMIENRFDAEKALRQQKREEEKPKSAGRPKGSKNKVAGA